MRRPLRRFGLSVAMGTVAAGALPACFTIAMSIPLLFTSQARWQPLVTPLFAFAPFLFAFPMVLAGSLCIGLPATAILRRLGREGRGTYGWIGAIGGLLLPVAWLWLSSAPIEGAPLLSLFGAVGGAIAGQTWWNERPRD